MAAVQCSSIDLQKLQGDVEVSSSSATINDRVSSSSGKASKKVAALMAGSMRDLGEISAKSNKREKETTLLKGLKADCAADSELPFTLDPFGEDSSAYWTQSGGNKIGQGGHVIQSTAVTTVATSSAISSSTDCAASNIEAEQAQTRTEQEQERGSLTGSEPRIESLFASVICAADHGGRNSASVIDRASTTLEHTNASTFVNGVANSACGASTTISGGGEVPEPETSCSHDTTNASVSHTSESIASTTTRVAAPAIITFDGAMSVLAHHP